MYRHAVTSYVMRNSLPSPEYTGDSDSDTEIIQELEQKRRQLDEEIARFKAQKDKEFREFEKDLRARRQNKKSHSSSDSKTIYNATTTTPNVPTSSTVSRENKTTSTELHTATSKRTIHPRRLMKPDFGAKSTSPTLCLDKLNIAGENTLSHHQQHPHTPPTPTLLSKINSQTSLESLSKQSSQESIQNNHGPTREANSSGIFDIPFLEAKLSDAQYITSTRPLTESHTEPTSPNGSYMVAAPEFQSSSLPSDSHISEEFQIHATKRSYTAPSGIRRNPLAPIIRTNSSRKHGTRKRKRVTFQLADRAIVDPSSSYEEGPSPGMESDRGSDSASSSRSGSLSPGSGSHRKTPRDQYGRKSSDEKSSTTKQEEIGMGMGDLLMAAVQEEAEEEDGIAVGQAKIDDEVDGYFSPKHKESLIKVPSHPADQYLIPENDQDELTKVNSFEQVDDDRYLQERRERFRNGKSNNKDSPPSPPTSKSSPRFLPARTQPRHDLEAPIDIDNTAGNVGFFELDEELTSPGADDPKHFNPEEIDDKVTEEDLELESRRKTRHKGMSTGLAAGSVPIDIIRPGWSSSQGSLTNSWIGTFGH